MFCIELSAPAPELNDRNVRAPVDPSASPLTVKLVPVAVPTGLPFFKIVYPVMLQFAGAVTTGLLAVRHLEPYADAVPRWISLGGVGLALLLVGITWESRRRNLETAGRYLTALR